MFTASFLWSIFSMTMQNKIFDYLDYRYFLKDFYNDLKNRDKKYSHRYFALKLGVKSSGFFSEILSNKRNVSQKNILQLFTVLGFDKDESRYFDCLVNFNQAGSLPEKDYWLQKMLECKKVNLKLLNKDVYEYFSKWYYTAIREMLFYYKEAVDPKTVAGKLNPQLKADEVKNAITLLERLAMIEKKDDGSYTQKDAVISTGNQVKSVEVANFQLQTLDLAKNAVSTFPSWQRDISTLTLSISGDGFKKIVEILQKTRKEIIKVAQSDTQEDRVCQVNIQFFPLTKV
jgi:uncharacterized protein (TIGR02147 family)